MAGPYYLLHAILQKVPALWDAKVYDSLSNQQITEQIEGAHTLLTTYRNAFNCPYPDFIEHFFATTSRAVHELPDWFINGHWNIWVYRPDLVKDFLKNGPFTTSDAHLLKATAVTLIQPPPMKKCKDHEPLPPILSSQASTSSAKTEKPVLKWSKTGLSTTSKDGSASTPLKMLSAKDKVKAETQPMKKECSTAPVKPRGHKQVKTPFVEVSTKPHKKTATPPPTILAEDTHVDIRGQSPTLVTADFASSSPDKMRQDVPCVPGAVCFANTRNLWPRVPIVIAGVTAPEVHDNLLLLAQAAYPHKFFLITWLHSYLSFLPVIEMHDCNFTAADCQICLLLDTLHEAYEMHTAALCNLLRVFSSIEGGHDTDAMLKFAHEYPVGHRLMIDMGLIMDEDGLLQKVFNPQFRHYYPHPLQLHSEKTPELQLPAFMVIKDKKKKKQ
ncbi:hypothetical protein EDD85DRAFT_954483 [Armillaria nabsnona]|nr:hypothetical protein EDD85DRAFT_954483 [Armillaria nabsnona]